MHCAGALSNARSEGDSVYGRGGMVLIVLYCVGVAALCVCFVLCVVFGVLCACRVIVIWCVVGVGALVVSSWPNG